MMAEVESVIEPDGILDDFSWKSMVFIGLCFSHGENCRNMANNWSVFTRVRLIQYFNHG